MKTEPEIVHLFHEHDGEGYYCPRGFDLVRESERVAYCERLFVEEGFLSRGAIFGQQDASFFAQLSIQPTPLVDSLILVFSSFGRMATLQGGERVFLRNGRELCADLLSQIDDIVSRSGFVFIPPSKVMTTHYDGCQGGVENWWDRYFDYI